MRHTIESRDGAGGGGRGRVARGTTRGSQPFVGGLPAPLTPVIGREQEIADAVRAVADGETRLITFTGPAGIGKTRLALAVAEVLRAEFADGVCFVDLAALFNAAGLDGAIARALSVQAATQPVVTRLIAFLRQRTLLLVLDNFEQILEGASLVSHLLAGCARLVVLVTSRSPLRIYGEQEFDVAPLAYPPATRDSLLHGDLLGVPAASRGTVSEADPEQMLRYPAVQLFLQRARAANRAFALTPENAATIAALCARLDGLPLAIELTAAQAKMLTPMAMLEQVQESHPAASPPAGARHGRPPRHRTLHTAIAWSYDLLSDAQQRLLRLLAVCVDGFSADAAVAIAGSDADAPTLTGQGAVLDTLTGLVDASLVVVERPDGLGARYSMLATVRTFALDRLTASSDLTGARDRHAVHFAELAERSTPAGPEQASWLALLEREHANMHTALHWSAERGDAVTLCRCVAALWWAWCRRGSLAEGRAWVDAALALLDAGVDAAPIPPVLRLRTLNAAGALAWYQGDHDAAARWLERAASLGCDLERRGDVAHALMFLGLVALRRGERDAARGHLESALALYRLLGDRWGTAMSLTCLAGVPIAESDYETARRLEEESVHLFRAAGDRWGMTSPLFGLGTIAYFQGDFALARRYLEEVLAIRREIGDTWATAATLHSLGLVARASGDSTAALALFGESLTTPRALGNRFTVGQALAGAGGALIDGGAPTAGVRLLAAARAVLDNVTARPQPVEREQMERDIAAGRGALGAAEFERAWQAGRYLSVVDAVQEAHDHAALPVAAPPGPDPAAVLTRREREVAVLIAGGLTNRSIAQALTITEGTAGSHVEHILAKLGFRSRAQIAAWSVAAGLTA